MDFEIVTHCVHYAKLLCYQLSSLVLHPPDQGHNLKYTLCFSHTDAATSEVVRFFAEMRIPGVDWNWLDMPSRSLNRRSIGRNAAALSDADYCFGSNCFSLLADAAAAESGPLIFPRTVHATTLEDGDALLGESPPSPSLRAVPSSRWSTSLNYRVAVGGVQIVRADVCRERGYLRDHPRWQRGSPRWRRCLEDPVFRHSLGTRGHGIDLRPVYRIRHSAKGRCDPAIRL